MKIKDLEIEVICEDFACFEDREDFEDCFYCNKGEKILTYKDREYLLVDYN